MSKRNLAILGSTGSIGTHALEVVDAFPDKLEVTALAAGRNLGLLAEQVRKYRPRLVSVQTPELAGELSRKLAGVKVAILSGEAGLAAVAGHPEAQMVLSAVVGSAGLAPTLAAIEAGKDVALANKESLVMAGPLLMERVRRRGVRLIPVDSEHSAIFQALQGRPVELVRRVILSASGGPFLHRSREEMEQATPAAAAAHPTWRMGYKISVDSATLMNKALEVIEARWLFDLAPEKIEVLIHPQCLVHALVEFKDGSTLAQLSPADMRLPIAFAFSYPERWDSSFPFLNLAEAGSLTFLPVDPEKFPGLALGFRALAQAGTMPAVLNAANEAAVAAFRQGRIRFTRIAPLVRQVMDLHQPAALASLEQALQADAWARDQARRLIEHERD